MYRRPPHNASYRKRMNHFLWLQELADFFFLATEVMTIINTQAVLHPRLSWPVADVVFEVRWGRRATV